MRRIRDTEGTPVHRRAARYHMARCQQGGAQLHTTLRAEMLALFTALKLKARAVEDAEDEAVDASAIADATEVALENVIRDIDDDAAKLDRAAPA